MFRTGHFQGTGARRRGRPRGVHIVHEKHVGGRQRTALGGERPPDVSLPDGNRQSRLGPAFPRPSQQERVAGPSGETAEGQGHQGGQVVPPEEIFGCADRNGDDRRTETFRDPVGPLPPEPFQEPTGEQVRGVAPPPVFRCPDPLPDVPLVQVEGKGEIERPGIRTGRDRVRAGCGIRFLPEGGPGPCRRGGKVGRRGRKQRTQEGDLPGNPPAPGLPEIAEAAADPWRISGSWRGRRGPGRRGRCRTRSRFRRRSTGQST